MLITRNVIEYRLCAWLGYGGAVPRRSSTPKGAGAPENHRKNVESRSVLLRSAWARQGAQLAAPRRTRSRWSNIDSHQLELNKLHTHAHQSALQCHHSNLQSNIYNLKMVAGGATSVADTYTDSNLGYNRKRQHHVSICPGIRHMRAIHIAHRRST